MSLPWEKEYTDLNKYHWLTSVMTHKDHTNFPRDLRVANALMQYANGPNLIAFPSQTTLAQLARVASVKQVQSSLNRLEKSRAIHRRKIDSLSRDERAAMNKSLRNSKRCIAYALDLFWAYEAFEEYRFTLAQEPNEPIQLKAKRIQQGTVIVPNEGTVIVPYKGNCHSTPNTLGDTLTKLEEVPEVKNGVVPACGTVFDSDSDSIEQFIHLETEGLPIGDAQSIRHRAISEGLNRDEIRNVISAIRGQSNAATRIV